MQMTAATALTPTRCCLRHRSAAWQRRYRRDRGGRGWDSAVRRSHAARDCRSHPARRPRSGASTACCRTADVLACVSVGTGCRRCSFDRSIVLLTTTQVAAVCGSPTVGAVAIGAAHSQRAPTAAVAGAEISASRLHIVRIAIAFISADSAPVHCSCDPRSCSAVITFF